MGAFYSSVLDANGKRSRNHIISAKRECAKQASMRNEELCQKVTEEGQEDDHERARDVSYEFFGVMHQRLVQPGPDFGYCATVAMRMMMRQ